MASGGSLLEEDLSCPICFEDYNLVVDDKMPKLLLCLHTVCFTCIENLLSFNNILKCPICRAIHKIEEELEDLLDNDAIVTHIRSKQEHEDKKAALEVYWKECLEKYSYDIPDEELRVNVQELVKSSLNPIGDQTNSSSSSQQHCKLPSQVQRQLEQLQHKQLIQKQQEQQRKVHQRQQKQLHKGQQRRVRQGQQRHVQQEHQRQGQLEDSNWELLDFVHTLNEFFQHLNERISSPHSGGQRNDSFNQLRQELEEDQEEETDDDFYQDEETDDDFYQEEETDDELYHQEEETEDELDQLEDLGLQQLFVNDDEQEQVEEEEYFNLDDEEEQQQQQQQQSNYRNQSNASSTSMGTNIGRKIIVKGEIQNQILNIDLVKDGFSELYGPVDSIKRYLGTNSNRCNYAILIFRDNVCFVNGSYDIDGEVFKARLCSGNSGKVFVARLPSWATDMDVHNYFKLFGELSDFQRPIHCMSGDPVTYCFLTFDEEESVNEILRCEEHVLKNCSFIVKPYVRNY